jgi:hypothetical protein
MVGGALHEATLAGAAGGDEVGDAADAAAGSGDVASASAAGEEAGARSRGGGPMEEPGDVGSGTAC